MVVLHINTVSIEILVMSLSSLSSSSSSLSFSVPAAAAAAAAAAAVKNQRLPHKYMCLPLLKTSQQRTGVASTTAGAEAGPRVSFFAIAAMLSVCVDKSPIMANVPPHLPPKNPEKLCLEIRKAWKLLEHERLPWEP